MADSKLFNRIQSPSHCLSHLLPLEKHHLRLRPRGHRHALPIYPNNLCRLNALSFPDVYFVFFMITDQCFVLLHLLLYYTGHLRLSFCSNKEISREHLIVRSHSSVEVVQVYAELRVQLCLKYNNKTEDFVQRCVWLQNESRRPIALLAASSCDIGSDSHRTKIQPRTAQLLTDNVQTDIRLASRWTSYLAHKLRSTKHARCMLPFGCSVGPG